MNDRDRLIELIADIQNDFEKWCVECAEDGHKDHQPLGEYLADKLLQNGVIVPPCKVGDTVYEFRCTDPFEDPLDLYVVESTVSGIAIFTTEDIHNMNCFGKTVFLTKEDAERALKERENNEKIHF